MLLFFFVLTLFSNISLISAFLEEIFFFVWFSFFFFSGKMLRQENALWCRPINLRRCLFGAFALWTIFIIIYISSENFYVSKTAKEIWGHSKYVDKHLQRRKERLLESRSQATATLSEKSKQTTRLKRDRLVPLKVMFTNAGKQDREKGNGSMHWNTSIQVPLADLREKRSKLQVLLLVIVTSASQRQDRRDAIRNTWWRKCTGKVCYFVCSHFQHYLHGRILKTKMRELEKR